jgi:hypothetical protein
MAIGDDFTIYYADKRICHTSGTTVYTVRAFYSYLMDTFDELGQMDDPIPMSAQTPSEYTLINGWFMNEAREGTPSRNCFEFLKEGAIQTNGQDGEIQVVPFGATYTSAIGTDLGLLVRDDATPTGNLLDYDNTNKKWWVRWNTTIGSGSTVQVTTAGGTGTGTSSGDSTEGEQLWANIYTLGSIEEDDNQQIYIEQNSSRIFSGTEWWPINGAGTQHIDVLIKVKESSVEINGALITVFLRHYPSGGNADLYDHFGIDLTNGGRNAVPLATSPDINNTSTHTSSSSYSDITIAFVNGTITYSAVSGAFDDFEEVTGSSSTATAVFLYQTTTTGSGMMTLGNVEGTFENGETLTGSTSNETALASSTLTHAYTMAEAFEQGSDYNYSVIIDCATRVLTEVYEYLKYVTRIDSTFTMYPTTYPQGGPGNHSTQEGQLYIRAHEDNQTSPTNTFSPVKASPFGTFAGGKFFGAQGVWVENMDSTDIQNFQLKDSSGTDRYPPNKQSITITNVESDDRVSVFITSGGTSINKAFYSLDANNDSGHNYLVVTGSIATDTPASGTVRVVDDSDTSNARETRYTYNSWSGSTFTDLTPALNRNYTQTDDKAYVPFIDTTASGTSVTSQVIYTTSRTILVRVRRYQGAGDSILPFETTGTFGSTGYSTACIRTADAIVL